jgi:hypothetical protein
MFSVRLWNVPVASFGDSDGSIKTTIEVEFCAGGFFFVKFSFGYTNLLF